MTIEISVPEVVSIFKEIEKQPEGKAVRNDPVQQPWCPVKTRCTVSIISTWHLIGAIEVATLAPIVIFSDIDAGMTLVRA